MTSLLYRLKPNELGSGLHAKYMQATYPSMFRAVDFYNDAVPQNDRIWLLHNPFFYKEKLVVRAHDYSCVRANFAKAVPGKHLTNGFSYLKRHNECFDGFLPTVYQVEHGMSSKLGVGYYARDCRMQSNFAFVDFAKRLPSSINIVTMGTKQLLEKHLSCLPNWVHTYSNDEFWSSCTHYFYYRCSDFEDPFPHTLLEAVQSGHSIISIRDPRRSHQDGIDDILSCISFKEKFDFQMPAQRNATVLCKDVFSKVIEDIKSRQYNFSGLHKCKTFYDWVDRYGH